MAVTQEQIDALTAELGNAKLMVRYGEKHKQNRSVDEIQAEITSLRAELASQQNPTRATPRRQYADFSDD